MWLNRMQGVCMYVCVCVCVRERERERERERQRERERECEREKETENETEREREREKETERDSERGCEKDRERECASERTNESAKEEGEIHEEKYGNLQCMYLYIFVMVVRWCVIPTSPTVCASQRISEWQTIAVLLQTKEADIGSIVVWSWTGRAALAPAVCDSMLRCVAVSVLLYVVFCCRCGLERSSDTSASSVLHYISVCYSQRVAVCCSTLQFAAESANWRGYIYIYICTYIHIVKSIVRNKLIHELRRYLACVAMCCSVLQCVAVCCRVLHTSQITKLHRALLCMLPFLGNIQFTPKTQSNVT